MSALFETAAVFRLGQARLQLNAVHTALPKPLSNQLRRTNLRRTSLLPIQPRFALLWRIPGYRRVRSVPDHRVNHAQDFSAFSARLS